MTTLRTIHLHGYMGKTFGRTHRLFVETVAEAIEALRVNFKGFAEAMRRGHFRVILGKTAKNGLTVAAKMLPGLKLGSQDLHLVPVAKGAKRGGLGKVIAGVALVGLSLATGGSALMSAGLLGGSTSIGSAVGSVGLGLALTGVATLIAPQVNAEEQKQSFTMNGPQNTTREGGIVPIVYGEVFTGGTMIAGSLSIERKE